MSPLAPLLPELVLRDYFRAKDENRPQLLDRVFTADAVLEIRNDAATIAFPALTSGRDAIADVLVRAFGQTYENVYTFCLQRPQGALASFSCDWVVSMSEKASRRVRVGCGRYDWSFDAAATGLARGLVISIAVMQVLPPESAAPIFAAVQGLSYPWSSREEVRSALAAELEIAAFLQTPGAR